MNCCSREVTILYVEDEDDVREGYMRTLERISDNVYTAKDGLIGLEIYKKYLPDIVISDIKMPHMDGLKMAKAIKEINPHANIVFTTAHSESAYLLEAIELQAEGYLLKPVQKKSLVNIVQKLSKNIILERENKIQRDILQYIIDSDNNMSLITGTNQIIFANHSFLNFFNVYDIHEFNVKYPSYWSIFTGDSPNFMSQTLIKEELSQDTNLYTLIEKTDEAKRVLTLKDKEGKVQSFFVGIAKINEINYFITLTNITKLELQRENTMKKAYTDNLTGIYNRNKFEEVFEYELNRSKRYHQPLSMAILDIDHFKNVNDTFGHLIGDEILVMLAHNIKQNTRETDLFARWGGEEFVMLFINTHADSALKLAENLRILIENLEHLTAGKITISFGITELKENDTLESMLERADKALYKAKNSGRNCSRVLL
jgi:diguanylate cyclase (GGDEF)-like protein